MQINKIGIVCVACGSPTHHFTRVPARFDPTRTKNNINDYILYMQCLHCGTIQQHPLPSEADLSRMVEFEYAQSKKRIVGEISTTDKLENHHRTIVEILKHYRVLEDVFEVGTGVGNLCAYLMRDGITCSGIEISPKLVDLAQKRGLPIIQKDLYEISNAESFSALIMGNVFEHLSEPAHTLAHIYALLKPNGLFITDQPTSAMTNLLSRLLRLNRLNTDSNLRLSYLNLHQWHMVIYSVEGMSTLAAKHGFELVQLIPMPSLKEKGLSGFVRRAYQKFNTVGEWLMPKRWPFHVNHLFVFQKK